MQKKEKTLSSRSAIQHCTYAFLKSIQAALKLNYRKLCCHQSMQREKRFHLSWKRTSADCEQLSVMAQTKY